MVASWLRPSKAVRLYSIFTLSLSFFFKAIYTAEASRELQVISLFHVRQHKIKQKDKDGDQVVGVTVAFTVTKWSNRTRWLVKVFTSKILKLSSQFRRDTQLLA